MSSGWDALVLAGGAARRMNGTDKLGLDVGGRSMLDRVVDAVAGADSVCVVGPRRELSRTVTWVREDPPGTGPAAAVGTGLRRGSAPVVVVVAGDQPLLTSDLVDRLRAHVSAGGAVAVDDGGQPQWLCSAWPRTLIEAVAWQPNASVRGALAGLPWTAVPAGGAAVLDCDTEHDLDRARELTR